MLSNLIDNVIAYTQSKGTISVAVRQDERTIALEVSDDGIGVPAAAVPHLFERGFRAPEAVGLRPEGLGLGLPIVAALASAHGGSCEYRARASRGSIFTIVLPRPQAP